jgi:lysozyme family protein
MTPQDMINGVLSREGSQYTNNPADSGGPTKYGVTLGAYSDYIGRPATIADIQNLTSDQAYNFYWNKYYLGPKNDAIFNMSSMVGGKMTDISVNMGPPRAGIFLQTALNAFNLRGTKYPDMTVDGSVGQRTLSALSTYLDWRGSDGESVLFRALNSQQGQFYLNLAAARPKDEDFAYGWFLNRVS